MITAESPAPAPTDAAPTPERTALAGAIDAQARRMDQLSAAIVRATSQVTWSGRAAERFRARAAERSRECLQLAVALRASAERVHAAAVAAAQAAQQAAQAAQHAAAGQPGGAGRDAEPDAGHEGKGHADIVGTISGMVGGTVSGLASGGAAGSAGTSGAAGTAPGAGAGTHGPAR
ncbi:hypothetical protein [Catenulispora sp. EB89]|uniref:hypothetical protein n=1 Tax=Catenulispora sp. EB89 TaxID=3156257 RepID=UPI003516F043